MSSINVVTNESHILPCAQITLDNTQKGFGVQNADNTIQFNTAD